MSDLPSRARVVVIGRGVGGASTFYHLTEHGWTDVVLVERNELASGSTWHAAGQVTQFGAVQTMVGLKKYSVELYTRLAADPEAPITYRRDDGGIRLGYDQSDLDGYRHFIGLAKPMGVDFEVIGPSEMAEAHPLLDVTGLTCGLWDPVDGDIDPTGLVNGLCKAGRRNGGQVFRYTEVIGLESTSDGWLVRTNKGDIECESFVNAGGYRVHQVGKFYGLESAVLSMEHQFFLTEELPELEALDRRVPLIRDPGDDFYSRQEHNGVSVGIYEQGCQTWGRDHIPDGFANKLEPPDLDRIADNMERVMERLPVLQTAGISSVINGPISYSGDGVPLVGKLPGVRNGYAMLGIRAGIGEGGGLGKVLAEIIVDGESEWDSWCLDPRRFTQYADEAYASAKAVEEYQREFIFHRPDEHRPAGRKAKYTPLYDMLAAKGAEFGALNGWERVLYFHPAHNDFEHVPEFRFSTFYDQVGAEARAVRDNVGVVEISGFTRFEVQGSGADEWFNHLPAGRLTAGRLPAIGRSALAYVSDEKGRFRSEFTMLRLADDHFWLFSAAPAEWHDLSAAGEPLGMVNFGLLATESMRIEKNYRAWKHDLHTEYTVLGAGLERFVDLDKDFRGRDAIVAQRETGDRRRFVALEVTNDEVPAHTGDPIWAGDDLIGVVTSGGYGHTMNTNIAMGYVTPEHAEPATELAVDVIGVRSRAVLRAEPMFDPAHERPRAQGGNL